MKIFMLAGAMTGFALGIALGLAGHADWPFTLVHACVGAAVLGVLTRWWGRMWARGLHAALQERSAAETAVARPAQSLTVRKK